MLLLLLLLYLYNKPTNSAIAQEGGQNTREATIARDGWFIFDRACRVALSAAVHELSPRLVCAPGACFTRWADGSGAA